MELNAEREQITSSNNELYDYVKRIVAAVNYKCNSDHEDVPSILRKFAKGYEDKIKELTEENERLKNRLLIADEDIKRLRNRVAATIILTEKDAQRIKIECLEKIKLDVKEIQADTMRKMQEKLTKEFDRMHKSNFMTPEVRQWIIDQIAKEILEDNNND